jgi:hypothetical protein
MTQRVLIVGPNLQDQSKGSFVVHAVGCADLKRLARREPEVAFGWQIDAATTDEIVESIYSDIMAEHEGDEWATVAAYRSDVHIAPCVHLPQS